ncbi:hypothetical protein A2U01_0036710 [Trifolium medium]|uniref:Uncharacterized protein n=1 Tax=Trifolium medium TaxID=97028 RepID=A0A392PV72_9FABA|nr:hypothetical protein [Trifolium medium]
MNSDQVVAVGPGLHGKDGKLLPVLGDEAIVESFNM